MLSDTEENYLKALFLLASARNEVTVTELSRRLGTTTPTVNSMVKRLATKQLIRYVRYRPLRLTAAGRREAAAVIRRHRLAEMYLVQKMGFGWEEVHDIAEQVEHLRSPALFDRMDVLLNHPRLDPHGSPIPDRNGKLPGHRHRKLSECRTGEEVRLAAVATSAREFLSFLNSSGLRLGTRLTIRSVEHYDGSMQVLHGRGISRTLTHTVCELLLVDPA